MDTKLLKKVGSVFKYGARVIQDGQPPLDLVGLEFLTDTESPEIAGWAYPNKDKYYSVTGLEEREDGWLIQANGTRYLFKPLDKKLGQALNAAVEGY